MQVKQMLGRRSARGGKMKKFLIFCFVIVLFSGCAVFKPTTIPLEYQFKNYTVETVYSESSKLNYVISLPKNYDANKDNYPVIIFLHSMAERGNNPNLVIYNENGEKYGITHYLDEKDFPFIIVSPLCPDKAYWPLLSNKLNKMMKEIQSKYRIKKDSIYLTGVSMGGMGVWSFAMDYPEWFAAIVPISGGVYCPPMKNKPNKLKDISIWAFHSRNDIESRIEKEEWFINKLKEKNINIKYTIEDGSEHYIHGVVYSDDEIYKWLLGKTKS